MSWSDLLYPGNAEKREKIIRRSQELLELMKGNFRATNSLTEIVNTHLGSSFRPIALDEKATVKENCEVMIERVHEIQAKVQQVDEELKEKLEPALYERLKQQCQAIIGAFERSNLDETLAEYEEALAEFRPASEEYQDTITEVKVMLKCSKKK